jgi:hypothetical protein
VGYTRRKWVFFPADIGGEVSPRSVLIAKFIRAMMGPCEVVDEALKVCFFRDLVVQPPKNSVVDAD